MLRNNALTSATEDIDQIIKSLGNYEMQAVLDSCIVSSNISRTATCVVTEEHKQEGLKIFFTVKVTLVSNAGDWKSFETQSVLALHLQLTSASIQIYKPVCCDKTQEVQTVSHSKIMYRVMKLLVAFIIRLCTLSFKKVLACASRLQLLEHF